MQIRAKTEELCEMAEDHEDLVSEAFSDEAVTPAERAQILQSAKHISLAIGVQACRTRIGIRMIRGGRLDRHTFGEIADYQRLIDEEKAAECVNTLAA